MESWPLFDAWIIDNLSDLSFVEMGKQGQHIKTAVSGWVQRQVIINQRFLRGLVVGVYHLLDVLFAEVINVGRYSAC